jgi:hypothetical protein
MQVYDLIAAGFFSSGLLLAGSDGPAFPWPNLLGLALTGMAVWISRISNAPGPEALHIGHLLSPGRPGREK